MKRTRLTPIKGGFSVVVSAGSDPAQKKRIQFRLRIATTDEPLAQRRLAAILRMRDALVEGGRGPEAAYLMEQAGAVAADENKFRRALSVAERVSDVVPARSGEYQTWGELARGWANGDVRRQYPDIKLKDKDSERDLQRIEWLEQFIGDVPLTAFGKAEYRKAMANLPERCRTNRTRQAYGQIILKVMRIAHAAELIGINPLADTEAPKVEKEDQKFFTCIFPSELYRLLACADIPFEYRVLWGFMCIESPRIGKLPEVRWHHIERDGCGAISIESKNGEVLYWALAPGTLEALEELERRMPGSKGPFSWLTPSAVNKAAFTLRQHMLMAGNDREALHVNEDRRHRLRAHDCRATFVVNAKRSGRNEDWIRERTGHGSSLMIERYNRLLSVAAAKGWEPIGRLDEALGLRKARRSRPVSSRDKSRDSRPAPPARRARDNSPTSMISAVAPAGVEPALHNGKGILKPAQSNRTSQNRGVSAAPDTPEGAGTDGLSRLPVTLAGLTEQQLTELVDLARASKRWHLLPVLGSALDELARATPTNVASLDAARAKRDGGK